MRLLLSVLPFLQSVVCFKPRPQQQLLTTVSFILMARNVIVNGFTNTPYPWKEKVYFVGDADGGPLSNRAIISSSTDSPKHLLYQHFIGDEPTIAQSYHHDIHFKGYMDRTASLEQHAITAAYGMPWKMTFGHTEKIDPLLYMPFWEWQMDFITKSLTNVRPDLHAMNQFGYRENQDKKARIVSHCYTSEEYRKIRMTYYDAGDNTQVFTSVFYPREEYNLPILGMDLLALNRKKYLAIVDFQPIHEEESFHAVQYEHRLKSIKDSYTSLRGQMSRRFYDESQFFSKQMLYSRFEDEGIILNELFPAFQRYVSLHAKLIQETPRETSVTQRTLVLNRQKAYDTYNAERDPAISLLTAMFGQEWSESFVFDFLFSLSERK